MKWKAYHKPLFPASLVVLALSGCETPKEQKLDDIAGKLNDIERSAEEWGRATISDIAWLDNRATKEGTGFFALDYTNPTSFYMDRARQTLQGTANLLSSVDISNAVVVQFAPQASTLLSGSGNGAGGTNTASPTASPIGSTKSTGSGGSGSPPSSGKSADSSGTSGAAGTNSQASKPVILTVQSNVQPEISESVVLKIGATDKVTERILDYMSDPIRLPDNKKAYLGVMQVSLLPGWKTRKGYIAEVQVRFEYALSTERASNLVERVLLTNTMSKPRVDRLRQIKRPGGFVHSTGPEAADLGLPKSVPTIISAFPFAESQVLDLASSYQRQLSFLTQLAGSVPQVPGLQAALSSAFKKLTQQSVATRNAVPLVVPSSQGSDVTYRFDPELEALVNPASTTTGPGHVLEPSSFPALIVAICEDSELLTWDTISASVETRWIPVTHRNWFKKYSFDWWYYGYKPQGTFSNTRRLKNAYAFDQLNDQMEEMLGADSNSTHYAAHEIRRRFENLKGAATGRTLASTLPPLRPWVTAVYPARFRKDYPPDKIDIEGRYFNSRLGGLEFVGLQGMPFDHPITTNEGRKISVNLSKQQKAQLAPGEYEIEIVTGAGKTVWTNAITVLPTPAPVIDAVIAKPLKEDPDEARWRADTRLCTRQRVDVAGRHFSVGDDSLKVAIGGTVRDLSPAKLAEGSVSVKLGEDPAAALTDKSLSLKFREVSARVTDESISFVVDPNDFNLKPGSYDLTILTSGGQDTRTNAVHFAYQGQADGDSGPPPVLPVVTSVYPDKFRLDDYPPELTIQGDFFQARPQHVNHVALGDISLDDRPRADREHSLTIGLPPRDRLLPGTYNLELVNQAGHTVVSNAVEVLPVPAPQITAVVPMPLALKKPAGPKPAAETKPGAGSPGSTPEEPEPEFQRWAIQGTNFVVYDGSLQVSIGAVAMSPLVTNITTTATAGGPTVTTVDIRPSGVFGITLRQNNLLLMDVSTNLAKSLGPGKHELAIITSGGMAVLSNAVTIADAPRGTDRFAIIAVYPNRGALYSTSVFGVLATNGTPGQGCLTTTNTPDGHQVSQVRTVMVGSRACPFWVLSDSNLVFSVPPWSTVVTSNDLTVATNKLDLVVMTSAGAATLSNAIAFDLTLPNDFPHPFPLSEPEQRISKTLDAVFAAARALGTNPPALETDIKVSASAGPRPDKGMGLGVLQDLYEVIRVRTNEMPSVLGASGDKPNSVVPPTPALTNGPAGGK